MMKSKFMQRLDLESEDGKIFKRGLEVLASLPADKLNALARGIPEIHRLRTSHEVEGFVEKQTAALAVSRADAAHVVEHVMFPLVRAFAGKYGEEVKAVTPELLGEDIVDTLHFVPAEKKGLFLDVVKLLKEEIAPAYERQQRLQALTAGVLPSWRGLGSTVEMRAVIKSDYKLGTDVQRYRPTCAGMIPVASISLRVDQGNPERFYFQVSEEELKDLIKGLEATLKELQEFKEHVSFK